MPNMGSVTLHREPRLDMARGLAVAAVFVLHASAPHIPSSAFAILLNAFARWAIPMLFMISGHLWASSSRLDGSPRRYLIRRAWRLAPSYLFWTVIYVTLAGDWSAALSEGFPDAATRFLAEVISAIAFANASYHLWFFPTLWLVTAIATWWTASYSRSSLLALSGVAFAFAVGANCIVNLMSPGLLFFGTPMVTIMYSSPFYWLLAFVLGSMRSDQLRYMLPQMRSATLISVQILCGAALLGMDAVMLSVQPFGLRSIVEPVGGYLLAAGLLTVFLRTRRPQNQFVWLGVHALGFYAVHPLLLAKVPNLAAGFAGLPVLAILTAFALSILYVDLAARTRLLAFTVK